MPLLAQFDTNGESRIIEICGLKTRGHRGTVICMEMLQDKYDPNMIHVLSQEPISWAKSI